MVKLSMNLLIKSTSGQVVRKPCDSNEDFLMRITHLYLENKQLEYVGSEIGLCKSLMVLYLYDNNLSEMPDLRACRNLVHVYAQNNSITRIENLVCLDNLQKLYLGHNKISFVEGLHQNVVLQELYVENQTLLSGEKLLFDPRSLASISTSLTTLNISGNQIDSLYGIRSLQNLRQLLASDNRLDDIVETVEILSHFSYLYRLEMQQNPICSIKKYRDLVIVAVTSLETLDGKEVSDASRQFLIKWKASKDALDRKKEEKQSKNFTSNELRFSSSHPNLAPNRFSRNIFGPSSVASK